MDFGMEHCTLALRLPALTVQLPHEPMNLTDGTILEICAADVSRLLRSDELSWNTKPKCHGSITTLNAKAGDEIRLFEFPCPRTSLHTFEVSCASKAEDCYLDVWSNNAEPWG